MAGTRRTDQKVVEIGASQCQVFFKLSYRAVKLLDLREPDFFVLCLTFLGHSSAVLPIKQFVTTVLVFVLRNKLVVFKLFVTVNKALQANDLVVDFDQVAFQF